MRKWTGLNTARYGTWSWILEKSDMRKWTELIQLGMEPGAGS
jgi:hypothetical protein